MGRVMRTGIDATGFRMVVAKVARSRLQLDGCNLPSRTGGISDFHRERLHINVAVGTIIGALTTANAPVFDNHLQRVTPANGAYGTAHHAEWIAALAEFADDPMKSSEGKLEAIQMAWLEEYNDNK